jgi:tetratricopeptide (TPR) repeat protein
VLGNLILEMVETEFCKEDTLVAMALYQVGILKYHVADYEGAEQAIKRSLVIAEKAYGEVHGRVANIPHVLGALYRILSKHDEAESCSEKALAVNEALIGSEHEEVARTLDNLASVYQFQGKHAEAEALYRYEVTCVK